MNNLPDGVNENTSNAPWNEELKTVQIVAILTLEVDSPKNVSDVTLIQEAKDELSRALYNTDFNIEEILIE